MRISPWLIAISGLVFLTTLASAQQSKATPPVSSRSSSPGFALVGSIKEIMQGIVDPASDVVFESVATQITAAGTVEKAPKNNEEWAVVRHNALMLAEAGNLLKIPGRRVAPLKPVPGTENTPGPEDLTPAQIQVLVDRDRPAFNKLAQGLTDAAIAAIRAVDARDVQMLFDVGESIDTACEKCHLTYWYPPNKRPARSRPIPGQQ